MIVLFEQKNKVSQKFKFFKTKVVDLFQVTGNAGADNAGGVFTDEGALTEGKINIMYKSVQIAEASDPGICEIFFVASSPEVDNFELKYWIYVCLKLSTYFATFY